MNNYSEKDMEMRVRLLAEEMARKFHLPIKSIEFIRSENTYGSCSRDGHLKIKIVYPDGEIMPAMEVFRTLAHELAHLIHFNHGDKFWELNRDFCLEIGKLLGVKIRPEIAILKRDLGDYKVIK